MTDGAARSRGAGGGGGSASVKGTVLSLLIAFALTLVFRAFVCEAFIIPTGSMAPTLVGRHNLFRSPQSGFAWAMNPLGWQEPGEGSERGVIRATDPMSDLEHAFPARRVSSGDRILALKGLYAARPPRRWEVAIFKNPEASSENFIKRVVGLPGEGVLLVDGDVFVRPSRGVGAAARDPWEELADPSWRVARKPERVQRAMWWPLFSSEAAPLDDAHEGVAWRGPWAGEGWRRRGRVYEAAAGAGPLRWDVGVRAVHDWAPYNAPLGESRSSAYPVRDLRVRGGVEPTGAFGGLRWVIGADGVEQALEIGGSEEGGRRRVRLTWSDGGVERSAEGWAPAGALRAGRATMVEFWRFDQRLEAWVGGSRAASLEWDWTPAERLRRATGRDEASLRELLAEDRNALAQAWLYEEARVEVSVSGAVRLHRLGLDRDVHYRPAEHASGPRIGLPGLGTHPRAVAELGDRQLYVLGDNSGSSKDSRLWGEPDAWSAGLEPTAGVVSERMLLGRAFLVYFPAPHGVKFFGRERVVVPDVGRVRWIW